MCVCVSGREGGREGWRKIEVESGRERERGREREKQSDKGGQGGRESWSSDCDISCFSTVAFTYLEESHAVLADMLADMLYLLAYFTC